MKNKFITRMLIVCLAAVIMGVGSLTLVSSTASAASSHTAHSTAANDPSFVPCLPQYNKVGLYVYDASIGDSYWICYGNNSGTVTLTQGYVVKLHSDNWSGYLQTTIHGQKIEFCNGSQFDNLDMHATTLFLSPTKLPGCS